MNPIQILTNRTKLTLDPNELLINSPYEIPRVGVTLWMRYRIVVVGEKILNKKSIGYDDSMPYYSQFPL
jgi:hypothetical protein